MSISPEAQFQISRAEALLREREARRAHLRARAAEAARMLRAELGARSVWLFGSLSQPWFHERSDVDLAVEGIAPERIGEAWDRVLEIVGQDADLVCLEDADPGLAKRIRETGERLE